jgi:hypothetical protein
VRKLFNTATIVSFNNYLAASVNFAAGLEAMLREDKEN